MIDWNVEDPKALDFVRFIIYRTDELRSPISNKSNHLPITILLGVEDQASTNIKISPTYWRRHKKNCSKSFQKRDV